LDSIVRVRIDDSWQCCLCRYVGCGVNGDFNIAVL
jgi:hypothetical protein